MKLFRPFLYLFAILLIAAGILILPAFQTWLANSQLDKAGFNDTNLGFVSASFGKLSIEDFSFKKDGVSFTLPALDAKLPVINTLQSKQANLKELVAKGWILDLTNQKKAEFNFNTLSKLLESFFNALPIPVGLSIDGIELDGQIIIPGIGGRSPIHSHLQVSAGRLNIEGKGTLTFSLSSIFGDPEMLVNGMHLDGTFSFQLNKQRHLESYSIKANGVPTGTAFPDGTSYDLTLDRAKAGSDEYITTEVTSSNSKLLKLRAYIDSSYSKVSGVWSLNADQNTLGHFISDKALASFNAYGSGTFEYAETTDAFTVTGLLHDEFDHLEVLNPDLSALNRIKTDSEFSFKVANNQLTLLKLSGTLATNKTIATYKIYRPIILNTTTWNLNTELLDKDLLQLTPKALPLEWISCLTKPVLLSGKDADGDFSLKKTKDGFKLSTSKPFHSSDLTLNFSKFATIPHLTSSTEFELTSSSDGLHYTVKSLQLDSANINWLKISGVAFRARDLEQASTFNAKGSAHLSEIKHFFTNSIISSIQGDLIQGDISGTSTPASTTFESHLGISGLQDNTHFKIDPRVDFFPNNTQSLFTTVSIVHGDSTSDLTFEGSLSHEQNLTVFEAKVTGDKVNTSDLILLHPWLSLHKSLLTQAAKPHEALWGKVSGRVVTEFAHLETGEQHINAFSAMFEVEPDHIHMKGARGIFPSTHGFTSEGTLSYQDAKSPSYSLRAQATMNELQSSEFLLKPKKGVEPIFEGKFSFDADILADANTVPELFSNATRTLHLHSTSGIIRLLKVNIGDTIPQTASVMSDTLGTVSQKLGSFFQLKDHLEKYRDNPISQNADNAISLTNELSEIGYDTVKLNATISPTGLIRLDSINFISADVHIRGFGSINSKNTAFMDAPLDLNLTLLVKGKSAELLKKAKLDAVNSLDSGFTQLSQPITIKGSLNKLDQTYWHDLLGKAANVPDLVQPKSASPKPKTAKEIEESRTLQDSELGLLPQ